MFKIQSTTSTQLAFVDSAGSDPTPSIPAVGVFRSPLKSNTMPRFWTKVFSSLTTHRKITNTRRATQTNLAPESKIKLSSLPRELLQQIAAYLEPESAMALTLTSRTLCASLPYPKYMGLLGHDTAARLRYLRLLLRDENERLGALCLDCGKGYRRGGTRPWCRHLKKGR